MINSYTFGEMFIDGIFCTSDLIIYPDHVDTDWQRKTGHQLRIDDIREILAEQPECGIRFG